MGCLFDSSSFCLFFLHPRRVIFEVGEEREAFIGPLFVFLPVYGHKACFYGDKGRLPCNTGRRDAVADEYWKALFRGRPA